jgi:hypothetical protein
MGFHICPLNVKVAEWFRTAPEKLNYSRIPIARMVRVDLSEATALVKQSDFRAGFNRHLISGQEALGDLRPLADLVSHLSGVTLGATFRIWCQQQEDGEKVFTVMGSKQPRSYPERSINALLEPNDLFRLEFKLNASRKQLWLAGIDSQQPGMGGQLLSVLYNIALDLGTERIEFAPSATMNAKQFYFHLDFGRKREDLSGFWELIMPRKIV